MASFDIIDSAGHAYRFLWAERRYLAGLALAPVIIKVICQAIVQAYGYESQFIRHALIGLPAFFAEGWMLSHVVRFAAYRQRWPYQPQGGALGPGDLAVLQHKAHGILSGTAMYVTIRFLLFGLMAALYYAATGGVDPKDMPDKAAAPDQPHMGAEGLIGTILLLAAGLWAFRLLWVYIPAAAGVSVRGFLNRVRGLSISFSMLGAALVGFLPLTFLFLMVASAFTRPFGGDQAALPFALQMAVNIGWIVTDTAASIVVTYALTMGFMKFMFDPARKRP